MFYDYVVIMELIASQRTENGLLNVLKSAVNNLCSTQIFIQFVVSDIPCTVHESGQTNSSANPCILLSLSLSLSMKHLHHIICCLPPTQTIIPNMVKSEESVAPNKE